MANPSGKLRPWIKYERLHHYPILRDNYPPDEALELVKSYEKKEREQRSRLSKFLHLLICVAVLAILSVDTVRYLSTGNRNIHLEMIPVFILLFYVPVNIFKSISRTRALIEADHPYLQTQTDPSPSPFEPNSPTQPCPKCSHTLPNLAFITCPECGHQIDHNNPAI